MLRRVFIGALLLAFPLTTFAFDATIWNFRDANVPGDWQLNGIAAEAAAGGLTAVATADGSMWTDVSFAHSVDALRMTLVANGPTEALFIWHLPGMPRGEFVRLPFIIQGNGYQETIDIDLSRYDEWTSGVDQVGLSLPRGAAVMILDMRFAGWNAFDTLLEGFKSFWTFDTFKAYSINFLWGPLLGTNEVARAQLYDELPPPSSSGNWIFFGAFAIAMALFGATYVPELGWKRRRPLFGMILLWTFAGSWILYDLRMGAEIANYAVTDLRTQVLPNKDEKSFRILQNFPAATDAFLPLIEDDRFVFLPPNGTPLLSFARYEAYPKTPVSPAEGNGARYWYVFWRPDIARTADGSLALADGTILAGPGDILKDFGDGTFLFRTRP